MHACGHGRTVLVRVPLTGACVCGIRRGQQERRAHAISGSGLPRYDTSHILALNRTHILNLTFTLILLCDVAHRNLNLEPEVLISILILDDNLRTEIYETEPDTKP